MVPLIRITYHDADSGEPAVVTLDPVVFVALVKLDRTLGREHALALLHFGATLVKPELTTVDTHRLERTLTALDQYIAQWDDPAELALALSYAQLRDHHLTNDQAAQFAAVLLDQPMRAMA